jgi:uncharacterized delta-60 repeat protein
MKAASSPPSFGYIPSSFLLLVLSMICATTWVRAAQSPTPDDFNPGADGLVWSIAVQADARVLVGGVNLTNVAGQPRKIARLLPDGTLESSFNPVLTGWADQQLWANSLALQASGSILVGGRFAAVDGEARTNLARLNPDGSIDKGFNSDATSEAEYPDGVTGLLEQADGKILVIEGCAYCTGALVRFNPDGTRDTGFSAVHTAFGPYTMAIQSDGKILIGGAFQEIAGQARTNIARLNTDGTLDPTFNPGADGGTVDAILVQPDDRILVAGGFTRMAGQPRSGLARLNPDGTIDATFNPQAATNSSFASPVGLQTDGKIVTTVQGPSQTMLVRLNSDGSLDDQFSCGVNGSIKTLTIQADGKILVGGGFSMLGGLPRANIGRINNTAAAAETLSYRDSTITWLRGGSSPEVWRTTFEAMDGEVPTELGPGQRIAGGWQITNVHLASTTTIRALGFVANGGNGQGIVESTLPLTSSITNAVPPYDALYCFGFSWTDTQGLFMDGSPDFVNHKTNYWNSHSCNGLMWPEFASTNLGLVYLPSHNLARGGATTADTLTQVSNLPALQNPERNLYVVWVAAGDVLNATTGIAWNNDNAWNSVFQSVLKTSSNIVERLYAKGARVVVIQNCLDLSLAPQIVSQAGTNTARLARLKEHSAQFNSDLATTVQSFNAAIPDLRLLVVDVFALENTVYADPGAYGFTKVYPDAISDKQTAFDGPGKDYMFWDGLHGNSKLQKLVSDWTLEALTNSILERLEPVITPNPAQLTLQMQHLQIGRAYTVQTSSDLRSWQDSTDFVATAGTCQWSSSITLPPAFYRLKWQP